MSAPKKKTFKIEPFKHRVEMDPKYAEKTWKLLEHAIHEIYNHNASGLSFEELYRYFSTFVCVFRFSIFMSIFRFLLINSWCLDADDIFI